MEEEADFPRGRRRTVAPEKKRAVISTEEETTGGGGGGRREQQQQSKRKRTADEGRPDFLFGSAADGDDSGGRHRRSSIIGKRLKAASTKVKASSSERGAAAATSKSLMPLGGGAVVVPPPSDRGDKNRHQQEGWIEPLSFQRFSGGMRLLAVCREVHEDVAIFSLPNLWTGYMLRRRTKDKDDSSSSERSPTLPPLDDALEVNQVLSVVVVRAVQEVTAQGHRRRIEVTCAPDRVNSSSSRPQPGSVVRGRVASIEDRGVLIDLGWKRRGFLSFEDIETKYTVTEEDGDQEEGDGGGKVRLTVHRILDFVVSEKVAKRGGDVVSVRLLDRTRMARHTLPPSCRPALADLQPGTLTTVRVEKTVRNGLCVTFGPGGGSSDVFRGAIELSHLGGYWLTNTRRESTDWKSVFEKHKTFPARLLAVDPVTTKIVRLTLQPHLLALQPPPSKLLLPPTGTVVQNCPVIRLDPGLGALLALPTAAPSKDHEDDKPLFDPISTDESYRAARRRQAVYVHISKAMDEGREDGKTPEALFAKQFAPSTVHTVRIIGTANLIEGVASGATAESIVSAHVLTHADLVPGKVMKQVPVYSLLDRGGVLVDFGMGIHGLIPEMHLFDQKADSDFRTKLRKVKYAVGAKVDVRVLSVDPVQKLCTVTAKKSLVRAADAAVIDSFQDARIGQKGTGYVSKVDDQGLAVTFYNGVYGRVTKRSLAAELGVENHKENYHVGDVVQCRVVNKKIKTKRRSKFDQDEDAMDVDGENESRRRVYHELTLSLAMNAEGTEDAPMRTEVSEKERPHGPICLRAGHILPQRSLRVVELVPGRVKERGLVPGYAIVSIKSKYMVDEAESATMPPYLECKLPFEQLLDEYNPSDIETAAALDELGARLLTVGKKINRKGFVLTDPKKSVSDYSSGTGNFAVVSVRPKLVETIEAELNATGMHDDEPKLPGPDSQFYVGAVVRGFVTQLHPRHGAFIRFLDGMTGLVPKLKGGLHLPLFSTVTTKVIALDTLKSPPKILLAAVRSRSESEEAQGDKESIPPPLKIGDQIQEAEIEHLDFYRARVKLLDNDLSENKRIDARIHCTMMERQELGLLLKKPLTSSPKQEITEVHPFHKLKVGTKLEQLRVVSVEARGKSWCVELTNKKKDQNEDESPILTSASQLTPGTTVSGIVTSMAKHGGLWIQLSPRVSAHVPALELSEELDIVRHPEKHFPIGSRLGGVVMDKSVREKHRSKYQSSRSGSDKPETHTMFVSPLLSKQEKKNVLKPLRGDLIIGRIDRRLTVSSPPALMLELRGGFVGRCCVTELEEVDDWTNMPLGHPQKSATGTSNGTDHAAMEVDESEEFEAGRHDDETSATDGEGPFPHGKVVQCRVLSGVPSKPMVEVSLRSSRIEGDFDEDQAPEQGDTVQAYVESTNKKGCFLRLSRQIEGRVVLKELSDDFVPDPAASFPQGRLIIGTIKDIRPSNKKHGMFKFIADIDMRESTLVDSEQIKFEDITIGAKYKGTVSRVADYGVFVRLQNSKVSGLAHLSECSDNYIKNIYDLYDPGDLVKVLVMKKDNEKKQIGFSLKASHFENDEDSDGDSSVGEVESDTEAGDSVNDLEAEKLESDDENFASKLAARLNNGGAEEQVDEEPAAKDSDADSDSSSDGGSSISGSGSNGDSSEESAEEKNAQEGLDTNVGFDWSGTKASKKEVEEGTDEDSDSESDDDDEADVKKSSHRSRKKQAKRRREEQEIAKREAALADGTADDNPETAADFERLLAGNPNSSEIWIRYMSFHLALADVQAAREVAMRAFGRIEFRQEQEKLNVWCALLTLELRFGSAETFQGTIDRACQHNNPKQVYLRACEIIEKEHAPNPSPSLAQRADDLFAKMCKKFKDKKKVWIAYMEHLLKSGRFEEAHALSKRAMLSLPSYKHVETMSKFAQLVFEYGSAERARTLFDGLLLRYPKRLDLLFVYADKEVKHGDVEVARSLFARVANPHDQTLKMKLSDKQMKSFFKKWFTFEEIHGTEETQERVKDAARAFVEQTTTALK